MKRARWGSFALGSVAAMIASCVDFDPAVTSEAADAGADATSDGNAPSGSDSGANDGGANDGAPRDGGADADAGPSYRAVILADGPRGYWRLAEASGVNAFDETGAYAGSYTGSVALGVSGALLREANTAAQFDSASACVNMNNVLVFSGAASFTLEAWISPNTAASSGSRVIVGKMGNGGAGGAADGYVLQQAGQEIVLRVCDGSSTGCAGFSSGAAVPLQIFSHVVATSDGTTARVYVNGNNVATGPLDKMPAAATISDFTIGCPRTAAGKYFDGVIDEVAVYAKVLSATAIKSHYDAR